MEVAAALQVVAKVVSIDETRQKLLGLSDSAGKAEDATDKLKKTSEETGKATEKLAKKTKGYSDSLQRLASIAGKVAGTLAAAFSVGAYIRFADAWSDMQSKVGAAVKDMSAAPALMERMVDLANASYSPLDQTVEVYSRNVGVLKDLGYNAMQTADFTEALNHALVITATKGEKAASVQDALSKAMAVGKLQADGLETILASGGRVAEALAEKLGTTVSGLRKLASDGKITGAVIAGALVTSLEKLREEAGNMPATVADGMTRIATGIQAIVGVFDQITGSSGSLAGVLVIVGDLLANIAKWLSANADLVQDVFGTAVTTSIIVVAGLVAKYAAGLVLAATYTAALTVATTSLSTALTFLRGALIKTGIGALVVLAGFLVHEFLKVVAAVGGVGKAFNALGPLAEAVILGMISYGKALMFDLSGVASYIQAAFLQAFSAIGKAWDTLANGIASTWNLLAKSKLGDTLGLGEMGESNVGGWLEDASTALYDKATSHFGMATDLRREANAGVKAAWTELTSALSAAKEETDAVDNSTRTLGKSLEDVGEKGKGATKKVRDGIKDLKDYVNDFKSSLGNVFTGLVTGAMSLRTALSNVLAKLAEMAASRAFETLWDKGGLGKSAGSFLGKLLGFAKGGVFDKGAHVKAFAKGGVISEPTNFPMKGAVGLMGEAGPEAIMPLKRGANGKLGVEGGQSVIRVELGQDLVAEILQQSTNQSIQVTHANNRRIPDLMNKHKKNPRIKY